MPALVCWNGNESTFSKIRQTSEYSSLISSGSAPSDQLDSHKSHLGCGSWTATEPEQQMRQSLGKKSRCEREWQSEEHWDLNVTPSLQKCPHLAPELQRLVLQERDTWCFLCPCLARQYLSNRCLYITSKIFFEGKGGGGERKRWGRIYLPMYHPRKMKRIKASQNQSRSQTFL